MGRLIVITIAALFISGCVMAQTVCEGLLKNPDYCKVFDKTTDDGESDDASEI